MRKDRATKSIISKLIESASLQAINFIVGIILARILSPSDYGIYSILIIFINIAQTIVIGGFNSALIQQKKVDEEDFSTVFTFSLLAAVIIYVIIFITAPFVGVIYNKSEVILPLRIIALVLFPDILYSLVNARVARRMEFSFAAKLSITSVILTGSIGVFLALQGGGIWALVVQQIMTYSFYPILYCLIKKWMPKIGFSKERFKPLFGFGSRILLTDFINAVYANIQGMIIGIKYNAESLAFFNKGQLFPRTVMTTISESIQSVLFPVYADMQEDKEEMSKMLINNMSMVAFTVFPIMVGLFATSDEVITLLLTEKWISCAKIVKVFCVAYMFWPIDSMNLQAIKACGKAKTYLNLNLVKKVCAAGILGVFVFISNSVTFFSLSAIVIYVSDIIWNSIVMKKELGISLVDEMSVLWRSTLSSLFILIIMYIPQLKNGIITILIIKVIMGIVIYFVASALFNKRELMAFISRVKNLKNMRS